VWVVPVVNSPLYQIKWPDIGVSAPANLTRCKNAALVWAEQRALTKARNLSVAQRLILLNNFWWSTSPVRQIDLDGEIPTPEAKSDPGASDEVAPGTPQTSRSQVRNDRELLFVRQAGEHFEAVGAATGAIFKEFDSKQVAAAWIDGRLAAPRPLKTRRAAR
jgi:hypothetical protein